MNIESIQTFVGKLYTNKDFLTLFKHAPTYAFDLLKLSEAERAFFLSVDIKRAEKIYSIVKDKQLRIIQSAFPIFSTFFKSIFDDFTELFLQLTKNYSSSYEGKLRACADFHDFCVQKISVKNEVDPPFLSDLIRFEYLYLTIGNRKIPKIYERIGEYTRKNIEPETRLMVHEYVHAEDFHFPIMSIIRQLENGGDFQLSPEITHLLFIPAAAPRPRLLRMKSEFRRLLPYLDGESPFEILGPTIARQEPPEVVNQLPEALAFFKSNEILVLL